MINGSLEIKIRRWTLQPNKMSCLPNVHYLQVIDAIAPEKMETPESTSILLLSCQDQARPVSISQKQWWQVVLAAGQTTLICTAENLNALG